MSTKVVFRKFKSSGKVIALFPETLGDSEVCHPGKIMAYLHVGQHGESTYPYILEVTNLARPEDYSELQQELEGIYGELTVFTGKAVKTYIDEVHWWRTR